MASNQDGISIGTISGGIVNFGGAQCIAPITITTTTSGSGSDNTGTSVNSSSGLSSTTQRTISKIFALIKTKNN
ncbi:spore germination protein [Neobacillus drentensis]|uniref:spore germination protein n=1 Tax=Neobacillus drentensis TaxID=220684 RepID=UPI002FFFEAC1